MSQFVREKQLDKMVRVSGRSNGHHHILLGWFRERDDYDNDEDDDVYHHDDGLPLTLCGKVFEKHQVVKPINHDRKPLCKHCTWFKEHDRTPI